MEPQTPDIRLVFGQPQSGKTTRVRTMTADRSRVLYYDTAGHDYTDGLVVENLRELKRVWRASYRGAFRLIYRPMGATREERKASRKIDPEFAVVCGMVAACGDMTFVVEEVDRYADRGEYDDEFADLVRRGMGHYHVELIVVTQMPQGIGRLLTSCAHDWTIFQTRDDMHLSYFGRRCFGIDPADIRGLQKHAYIRYNDGQDSYWICRDNLDTGKTDKTEWEYLYDRAFSGEALGNRRDVAPGTALADDAKDGPADMPSTRDSGNPADGRGEGSASPGADTLPRP